MARTAIIVAALMAAGGCASHRPHIPADVPREMRENIRRLYFHNPRARFRAVKWLRQQGEAAAPAVPHLIRLLGDRLQRPDPFRDVNDPFSLDPLANPEEEIIATLASGYWPEDDGPGLFDSDWLPPGPERNAEPSGLSIASAPLLVEALDHPDRLIRIRAALTLERMDKHFVAEHLPEARGDPDRVDAALARILHRLCLDGLTDPDPFVRKEAMSVIAKKDDPRSVPELVAATGAAYRRVRRQAYKELAYRLCPPDLRYEADIFRRRRFKPALQKPQAVLVARALAGALEGPHDELAREAARALLASPHTPIPVLKRALAAGEKVCFVLSFDCPSMRLHGRPADDLLLLLQDPDLPDREFVIRAFPPPPGLVPDFFLEEPERTLSDREATRVAAALKTELEHSSASVRRAAASELAYYKSSSARRALLAAADDPEPWVRKAVAEALAHGRSPARAKELIRMLKEHPSRRARQTAVLALGQLLWPDFFWFPSADEEEGSRPALPEKQITAALVSALDDPSPRVRAPAASALARCSEKNARHALLAALTDQSVLVRAEAAWAAGIQKDKRALPRLKQMVQTGEKPERLAAVSALPSFGQPGELALVRAMTDADLDVRCDAANALGEDLSPRTITALCSLVRTGGRDAARRASWKLLPIKTQQVTEALAAALERPHPGLRARAAWELAERGDARGVPVLIERFDDPEVNWLPGRLQKPLGRKAVPALIDALGHQQRAVRMGAARSLGGLKAGAAAKPLNDVLTDRRADRLEVFAAAEALAQIGTPAARKALDRHLDHRSRAVRLIAAAALAGAGSTRGLPILVRTALTSKTDDDRSKAEQALEYLGAKAAPALAAELGRAGEAGRAAAEMLVRLRGPGLDALFGVLADEDHPGRARAAAALDDRDERPWALSADDVAASHAQRARLAAARVEAILDDDRAVRLAALKSLAPSNWAELRRLVRWPADSREAEKPDAREQRLIDALRTCLSDSDPAVRAAAIGPLARYVWAVSLEPLRRALKDEDVRVRLSAARALDQLETPSQHRTLAFLDAADAGARAAAVSALVAQGLRSVPDAIAALDDADPRVRIAAANTLAALMDPRATPALIEVLRGDKVAAVRAAAAAALGGPEEKKEAGTVEDIFADPQVGEGRPVAPPGIMDPAAVDPLIAALEDDAYLVRRAALFALVWPGDLRALRPILGMWTREAPLLPERDARVEPWRRPEWIEYVRDRDPALKAARALVRRAENDPASLERRLSLLDDLRPRVRLFAVTGLAADTEQITAELVRISLHDRNDVVRQAAARALAWGPKGAGRKGLVAGAKDPDPAVRRHALEAAARSTELFAHLGRGGPRGVGCRRVWVLDMFIAAMDDEDPAVRKTARLLVDRLPLPEKRTKEELRAWWREAWPWPFF